MGERFPPKVSYRTFPLASGGFYFQADTGGPSGPEHFVMHFQTWVHTTSIDSLLELVDYMTSEIEWHIMSQFNHECSIVISSTRISSLVPSIRQSRSGFDRDRASSNCS